MKTRITELLGIEYPIIQGGMAWVAEHTLAAAVSEAGGLGLIGAKPPAICDTACRHHRYGHRIHYLGHQRHSSKAADVTNTCVWRRRVLPLRSWSS